MTHHSLPPASGSDAAAEVGFPEAPDSSDSAARIPRRSAPSHHPGDCPAKGPMVQKTCSTTSSAIHLPRQGILSFRFSPRLYQRRKKPDTTHLKNGKGMKNPTRVNSQGVYVNARVAGSIKTKQRSLGRVCEATETRLWSSAAFRAGRARVRTLPSAPAARAADAASGRFVRRHC